MISVSMIEPTLRQAADSFGAGNHHQAERLCEQVLECAPDHPDALHLLGMLRLASGRAGEAISPLQEALRANPRNLSALEALSIAFGTVGEYRKAEIVIRQMLAAGADLPVVSARLGITLARQGKWNDALPAFEEAVRGDPQLAEAHYELGNALLELGLPGEALIRLERALALEPGHAGAHNALGVALRALGRTDEAVASFRRAQARDGNFAPAFQNLGIALLDQGRLEEARTCLERAIQLKSDNAPAYCALGAVLQEQGRWAGAAERYERALALEPGFAGAEYNLALARLYLKQFDRAWTLYERRLDSEGIRERLRKDLATVDRFERLSRWQGPGERGAGGVAVWGEQGIGDQLLYSTLIPDLIAAGVRFVYEVDARLVAAYERAFPGSRFVSMRHPPDDALLQAGRVLLAGSLPRLFRRTRESFAQQPRRLLSALPERVAHYRGRLEALGPGPKVALSWYSRRREEWQTPRKSVPLMTFAPLLGVPRMHFVDVQYGDTTAEREAVEAATGVRLLRFEGVDYFNDLEEVLAILEACDLLITTSNATAHFAGVLGKRTWLLYLAENPPFHYWAHDCSNRSIWYPAVEIVSAPHLSKWAPLVEHAAARLAQNQACLMAGRSGS